MFTSSLNVRVALVQHHDVAGLHNPPHGYTGLTTPELAGEGREGRGGGREGKGGRGESFIRFVRYCLLAHVSDSFLSKKMKKHQEQ